MPEYTVLFCKEVERNDIADSELDEKNSSDALPVSNYRFTLDSDSDGFAFDWGSLVPIAELVVIGYQFSQLRDNGEQIDEMEDRIETLEEELDSKNAVVEKVQIDVADDGSDVDLNVDELNEKHREVLQQSMEQLANESLDDAILSVREFLQLYLNDELDIQIESGGSDMPEEDILAEFDRLMAANLIVHLRFIDNVAAWSHGESVSERDVIAALATACQVISEVE